MVDPVQGYSEDQNSFSYINYLIMEILNNLESNTSERNLESYKDHDIIMTTGCGTISKHGSLISNCT